MNQNPISEFLDHLWLSERLSSNTLQGYRRDLEKIFRRLGRSPEEADSLSDTDLAEAVFHPDEKPGTQARALSACKRFFGWLEETGRHTGANPTRYLTAPAKGSALPAHITEQQIDTLLALPDTGTPLGLRDKALLELIYATGLRVSEAVGLRLNEIDLNRGLINTIGKGGKQRLVPVGEEALYWLERYLAEARPQLAKNKTIDEIFISRKRCGITRQLAWMTVKNYAAAAGIAKLSPHGLRHAFATHLVNHGADLRVVQSLLGHSDISTTQIYTHVANQRLHDLVNRHHSRS